MREQVREHLEEARRGEMEDIKRRVRLYRLDLRWQGKFRRLANSADTGRGAGS